MKALLLDLDGTLVDSAPGILACCAATLRELGVAEAEPEALRGMIGPPLRTAFRAWLGEDERVEEAVRLYRARYAAEGLVQASVYPGVPALLAWARETGTRTFVCTAKLTLFARRVADHFGLAPGLEDVFGAEPDGRFDDKADLIAHILGVIGVPADEAVMVGDRREDILAARRNGVPAIGALWGYGDAAELSAAGADHLCETAAELPALLEARQGRRVA